MISISFLRFENFIVYTSKTASLLGARMIALLSSYFFIYLPWMNLEVHTIRIHQEFQGRIERSRGSPIDITRLAE